jgi:drug/metabolite transporter (DMT)-like permease
MTAATAGRLRLTLAWAGLLLIDVAIQVAMKVAADHLDAIPFPSVAWLGAMVGEPLALAALAGYFATFVLWLVILQASPLSAAFPLTALTYVLVPLAAWAGLGEHLSGGQAAGIGLIILGVVVQHTKDD